MVQRQFTLLGLMIVVTLCAVYLVAFRQFPRPILAITGTVSFIMLGSKSVWCVNCLSSQQGQIARAAGFAIAIAGIACYGMAVYSAVIAVGLITGM